MARPTKQGIDYFPMDCDPDGKLELFIAENGCDGFGLLVMIWQMIYKGEGYYIKKDDDLVLRLRKESLLPAEKIVSVIENSIKRGIFSVDAVDKHGILTSSGIQKRFFPAAKRKKQVTVFAEYLLIQVSDFENLVIVSNNSVSVCDNATNVKEEVNVIEGAKAKKIPPDKNDTYQYFLELGLSKAEAKEQTIKFHDHHDARGWVLSNRKKMVDWNAAVRTWKRNIDTFQSHNGTGKRETGMPDLAAMTDEEFWPFYHPYKTELNCSSLSGLIPSRDDAERNLSNYLKQKIAKYGRL